MCAKRELSEETGFAAERWEELVTAPSDPVRSSSIMHAFIAYGARKIEEPHPDEGEILETELVPVRDWLARALRGELGSVPSLAVTLAALYALERLD